MDLNILVPYLVPLVLSMLFILELVSLYRNYSIVFRLDIVKTSGLSKTLINLPAIFYAVIFICWIAYDAFK